MCFRGFRPGTGYMHELAARKWPGKAAPNASVASCYRPSQIDASDACVLCSKSPDLDNPPCSGYERWSTKGPFVHVRQSCNCRVVAVPRLNGSTCASSLLKEKSSERTARERVTRELQHSTRTPTYHKRADKIWTRLSVSDRNGVAGDRSTAPI